MKKITLRFKSDADADRWMQAREFRSGLALMLATDSARVLVSTCKRKVKAAINKATL